MNEYEINLLKEDGWEVECESPLEIRHINGSFATGNAAKFIFDHLIEADRPPTGQEKIEMLRKAVRKPSKYTLIKEFYSPDISQEEMERIWEESDFIAMNGPAYYWVDSGEEMGRYLMENGCFEGERVIINISK